MPDLSRERIRTAIFRAVAGITAVVFVLQMMDPIGVRGPEDFYR